MSEPGRHTCGVCAVVLAAGLSSRMAAFKPLAPLGGRTGSSPLERTIGLFQSVSVDEVVVVTGHRSDEVSARARELDARPVHNPDFEQGMYSSVRTGVAALPKSCSGFFLLPVDIPLVRPWTLLRLLDVFGATGLQRDPVDIAHPVFLGERGHPPLIGADLCGDILAHDGAGGLAVVLDAHESAHPDRVVEAEVVDEAILLDMDTDAQRERLALRAAAGGVPFVRECEALWREQELAPRTRDHCRFVSRAALVLARAVAQGCGLEFDHDLVRGAALVHDLAKGSRHHEEAGAALLAERGFDRAAPVVAAHRDLDLSPSEPITERELVFMADKMVGGTTLMPLEERYGSVLRRHGHDPEARAAIEGRMGRALVVRERLESLAGRSLWDILAQDWGGDVWNPDSAEDDVAPPAATGEVTA